ncbi:MAG: MazG nucleotide pyrophosphohydrolase domain-containing protein [Thermodesulfobacteriota bacterium]|nr:MazG nucleotide pyrophosphohydrolase domain-containing protein [Thermodesulfobacteriota bacterium]
MKERKNQGKRNRSLFKGIPEDLPSLLRAYRITRRASRVGFDWPDLEGVLDKMDEELEELREALACQDRDMVREEIGDLLFVLTNIARFLRINPEEALKRTLKKFASRFHYIERNLQKKGKNLSQSNLIEMDDLWEKAKRKERSRSK